MTFKARYGTGETRVIVEVDEDDARAAYHEHSDDFEGESFEDNRLNAAEMAARLRLIDVQDDLPDNVELQTGACAGVWEVEE